MTNLEQTPAEKLLKAAISSKDGGEERPQQKDMVRAVEAAINNNHHLLIQAGTGVGKTLGYLLPIIASGKRAIISTATNQLSQQIHDLDLPLAAKLLKETTGRTLTYTLVKGRANYLCLAKHNEMTSLEGDESEEESLDLFESKGITIATAESLARSAKDPRSKANEFNKLYKWAEETETGDRNHAPSVSGDTWKSFSSTSAECPGRSSCAFGEECFTELARDKGRGSDIVVTNHALVGLDLTSDEGIFGEREVLVMDEAHEMDSYLTSAWGTELTVKALSEAISATKKASDAGDSLRTKLDDFEDFRDKLEAWFAEDEEDGEDDAKLYKHLPEDLASLLTTGMGLADYLTNATIQQGAQDERRKAAFKQASGLLEAVSDSIYLLLDESGESVRWVKHIRSQNSTTSMLCAAPLRTGPTLMKSLDDKDLTLIATSATITVAGSFDIPIRNLALEEPLLTPTGEKSARTYHALDVGTPFNYPKQGILFIPSPDEFAAPVGKERFEHTEDVKDFAAEAIEKSKGRALVLSSTTRGAQLIGEHLRKELDTRILVQGDMPAGQIVDEFVADVDSTLVGTMGFWHGLDSPGETCSLVIIDKIPFSPMNDPLMKARQEDAAKRGGNGFMDVYVANANVMLSQGVGRLIRHSSDRGVVAILDTRLSTKPYGRAMVKSLPNMYRSSNREAIMRSLGNI